MLISTAVLLALTPVTAAPVALAPAEPAPTNVRLSWASEAHEDFVVTWEETGDVRNLIEVVAVGGSEPARRYAAPAGGPNRVTISSRFAFERDVDYRIRVSVADAGDVALSDPATSAVFDTDRPARPVLTGVVPRADGSIRFTWVPGAATVDDNPGDPLDLPADPVRFRPVASSFDVNEYYPQGPEVTGPGAFVVSGRAAKAPVDVGLQTRPNEWGDSLVVRGVSGTKLTATVPATAPIGGTVTVTGQAFELGRLCDIGPCSVVELPRSGRELQLQTRAGADARWRTVATTTSGQDGTYRFRTAFAGTGQYRVVAQPVPYQAGQEGGGDTYGETTAETVTGVDAQPGDNDDGGGAGGGGGLPITGTPVMWIVGAGGLLVLLGVVFAVLGRVRRRTGS